MCSFNMFVALVFVSLFTMQSCVVSSVDFHVGVILDLSSSESSVGRIGMRSLSMALTDFYSLHADYRTRLVLHPIDSNGSVVDAASAALQLLRDFKVDAIIGPQKSTQANFVMDLGERANVPIISFSATSPSLVRSPYFVQTAQSDANQVQAIASIVKEFMWTQVVIINEDTQFGNGIVSYLSNALQDVHARVTYRSVLSRSAMDEVIRNELQKMNNMQTRVFVVHMSQFLAAKLFLKARELGMMSEGYVWIVTSGLTDLFRLFSSDVVEAMEGVLGVRPLIPKSERFDSFASRWRRMIHQDNHDMKLAETSIFGVWAYDALWALGMAAERVGNRTTDKKDDANLTMPFSTGVSETGPELLKVLLSSRFTGLAGEFSLDNGQLVQTAYEVVNLIGIERPVGKWTPNSASKGSFKSIIWPGDSTNAPKGWEHPLKGKKLRIAVPLKPGFNDFLQVVTDPKTKETKVTGHYRDVFADVMKALPYDLPYEFHPYPFFNADGSSAGNYDDLVRQVYLQKDYDGGLGDITITADRSNYVDFTMPYAEGGVACIVPIKYEDVNDSITFLQPFSKQLWFATAVLYILTSMVTWFLAKRLIDSSRDLLAQHAGIISLFPFFPGDGIQVSLIILILVSWAFVANLLTSTYTASLSSKLTVARLLPAVTDVNQLMKNGDYVGCQDGSFLVSLLMRKGFDRSKIKKYKTVDDSIKALDLGSKKNGTSAYCDVLPHIRAILSESCGKYMMIDPIYRTDGFAFVFPLGFPAVPDISRAIVQVMENGSTISEIKQHLECLVPNNNNSPTRVSLRSFLVLFAITGFVTLVCLLISLLIHLHNRRSLRQRIRDFTGSAWSIILALCVHLRRKDLPSLPVATDARQDTPTVKEITSSNDRIMEIEVMPHHQ